LNLEFGCHGVKEFPRLADAEITYNSSSSLEGWYERNLLNFRVTAGRSVWHFKRLRLGRHLRG